MNTVNITGRIGQEPKVHTFDNGDKQTSFSVAVNNGYYDKEKKWIDKTIWANVVKRGETKYQKGDLIEVSGKLNVREYTDKSGLKKYITEVVAKQTGLLNRKTTENDLPKPAANVQDEQEVPLQEDTLPF